MRCAIASSAVLGLSAIVMGDVSLSFDGMVNHEAVYYDYDGSAPWDAPSRPTNRFAFAGDLGFNGGDYDLFCIQLLAPVSSDSETYQVGGFDPSGELYGRSRILSSLFDQYYAELLLFGENSTAAAFAMMTWEIMTENIEGSLEDALMQFDLTEGAVQFGDYSEAAGEKFAEMKSTLTVAANSDNLLVYSNDEYQNFVGYVPAPGAFALLAIAGLAGKRRRRRA